MSFRGGDSPGKLLRTTVTLFSDPGEGEALDVDATVFVPDEPWIGSPTSFIGYSGFLERVRIALAPQDNHFYFGGY